MRKIREEVLSKYSGEPSGMVTIVVTNYKKEPYLRAAIESCLNQTYKDIEIIVIDDASNKSKAFRITKGFKANNIRFLYTSKNYGHYACCNYAMDIARGRYITFLGADDQLKKDHVRNLLIALELNGLSAVCSTYSRFTSSGKLLGKHGRLCEASILFDREKFIKDIGYFHMIRFAADTEYRMRAIRFYGARKVGILNVDSYKAITPANSLTQNPKTKLGSKIRSEYVKQFVQNIKISSKKKLRFDYKKDKLPFKLDKAFEVKGFDTGTFRELIV